jgi:hypothetical protein
MSPLAMPDHLKNEVREKLIAWYAPYRYNSDLLDSGEKSQIERLIDYIEVVEKGHHTVSDDKEYLYHDFKSFYTQYDFRRKKDFRKTFPQSLVDWYNTIEVRRDLPIVDKLWDGAITHYETGDYDNK